MHDHFHQIHPPRVIAIALVCGEAKLNAQSHASPPGGIDNYEPGPDSKPQPGVPNGRTPFRSEFEDSRSFPEPSRHHRLCAGAVSRADKPACVVCRARCARLRCVPVVFDNLIHKRRNARDHRCWYFIRRRRFGKRVAESAIQPQLRIRLAERCARALHYRRNSPRGRKASDT